VAAPSVTEPIATARFDLIPLGPADADDMAAVLGDERLYSFIGGRPPTVEELRSRYAFLASGRSSDGHEEWHNWIVRRRTDGQAVGTVQATVRGKGAVAEVAWVVGTPWQAQGVAGEAARALVGWLESRGVVTISAHVHPDHHASGAVATTAGLAATGDVEDGEQVWRRKRSDRSEVQRARLRRLATAELTEAEIRAIRELLAVAFGPDEEERFTEEDWDHAVGGVHFVLDLDDEIVAHASVVERELHVGGRPLRTGHVEAVATAPQHQGRGFGSRVMRDVGTYVRDIFELGSLGTGSHHFYERLGWRTWRGLSSVRIDDGEQRTPDDDGYIMVLTTPSSPPLDLAAPISCEWRRGDVW
jgi:RimJ/RimL family protein N-acetyltransferase